MRKLNICFISYHAYPLFDPKSKVSFGGSEVQLFIHANNLSKLQRARVSFLTGDFGQPDNFRFKSMYVYKASRKQLGLLTGFVYGLRLIRQLSRIKADVYIQRGAGPETAITSLFCKLFQKKFIYMTAHEQDCDGSYIAQNRLVGWAYKHGIKLASLVVTQSVDHQKLLQHTLRIKSKTLASSYPVPPSRPTTSRQDVLWVARLVPWKRPEYFLDLAEKFPNQNFVMIAPSSEDKKYANKIISRAKSIKNVRFIDRVPFHRINKYFRHAKVLVNTSEKEGFPNTFVQAALNGTPVLSVSVNPDKFLQKYKCGYFSNHSQSVLARQLKIVTNNPKVWLTLSKNGYHYAKSIHNQQAVTNSLISLISETASFTFSEKTKILHFLPSLGEIGGTESMLLKTTPKLVQFDHVFVGASKGGRLAKLLRTDHPVYSLNYTSFFSTRTSMLKLIRIIKRENPDLVVTYLIHADLLGRICAKLAGDYPVACFNRGSLLQWKFLRVLDFFTKSFVTHYLANSKTQRSRLIKQLFIPSRKISTIENGLDPDSIPKTNKKKTKLELGINNEVVVGYVGRLRKKKGLPELIEALTLMTNEHVKLVIVGGGRLRSSLSKLVKFYNLNNKVIFTGTTDQVFRYYQTFDIFVLPTHEEGMPNVLIEAMAMKIPVVTTNIPECREVVSNTALLVERKSPIQLAQALDTLVSSKRQRQDLASKGYHRFKKHFTVDQTVLKLNHFYSKLAGVQKNRNHVPT